MARTVHGRVSRNRERRHRRVFIGFVVATLLAGATGLYLGIDSHTTPVEMAAQERADRLQDVNLSSEVNRVLLELWKMEDLERAPRRP